MQQKSQEKRRGQSAKPPAAAGGGTQTRMLGGHRSIKGSNFLFASAADHAKGLATLLYGIQDSFGLILPGDKLRRQQMVKEVLIKRALSPPPKRLTLRWRNFHPKPSRLSMMSSA